MKRTPSNPSLPQSLPQSSRRSSASSKTPTKPPKSKSPGGTAAKKPKASTSKGTPRPAKAASASVAADPSLIRAGTGSGSTAGTGSAAGVGLDVGGPLVSDPVVSTEAVTPHQPLSTPCGSKRAQLVALLQSPAGASMAQMMALTGWQSHTVRGLISGTLRKRLGLTVQLTVNEGQRVYRIVEGVQP